MASQFFLNNRTYERGKHMTTGVFISIFLVGIPLFLLTEHPIIFWFIFVPLAVMGVLKIITWFKK